MQTSFWQERGPLFSVSVAQAAYNAYSLSMLQSFLIVEGLKIIGVEPRKIPFNQSFAKNKSRQSDKSQNPKIGKRSLSMIGMI